MRVFVSYRRDDTGGRAGRLFDVLAAKYGARNVFQDVASAAPGHDFVVGVDTAIERSEAVLVVIGPSWATSVDGSGRRRLDRPDDFVRKEVGTALAAGMPVVPVLVDGGELPDADQLPDELSALVRRQAVTIRDETWHQDVEALIRRLEGEMLAFETPRRRWPLVVGGVVVLVAALVVALALRDGDETAGDGDGDEIDGDGDGELVACPATDDSWTALDVADTSSLQHPYPSQAAVLDIDVVGARTRPRDGGGTTVLVDVEVTNRNEPVPGTSDDEFYFGLGDIAGIVVDGFDQGNPACMHTNTHAQLAPGERTIGTLGWDTEIDDASGVPIILKGFDDLELVVVDPAAG